MTGKLVFSSPDQPAELTQPDAGVVEIAFGQVAVGATKSLALDFASIGSAVTIGALAVIQPDAEFGLPFVTGTLVQATPSQITVSFTPSTGGIKSGQYKLTDYSPGTDTGALRAQRRGACQQDQRGTESPRSSEQVEINQSQSLPLTITNDSQAGENLVLSAPQGQDPAAFTVGPPSSAALAPGDSATLNVTFTPRGEGAAGASFTVSGVAGVAPVTVDLGGVGLASWIQVTSPLSFGFVQLGGAVQKSVVVTNLSTSTTLHLVAPRAIRDPARCRRASCWEERWSFHRRFLPAKFGRDSRGVHPLEPGTSSRGPFLSPTDDPLGQPASDRAAPEEGYRGGPHICVPPAAPTFGPVPPGYFGVPGFPRSAPTTASRFPPTRSSSFRLLRRIWGATTRISSRP